MISVYGAALLCALVLNASANLLMKVGMTRIDENGGLLADGVPAGVLKILSSPVLLIGLVCFAMNAAFYMFALQSKAMKISLAYPLMVGGGYAIIALVGYGALGERLGPTQLIGVGLILLGVCFVAGTFQGAPAE